MLWAIWLVAFLALIMAGLFEWWRLFAIASVVWLATSFIIRMLWDRTNNRGK